MAVFEDRVYYTDWENDGVNSVNKFNGGEPKKVMQKVTTPMTVRIYHQQAQPVFENKVFLIILYRNISLFSVKPIDALKIIFVFLVASIVKRSRSKKSNGETIPISVSVLVVVQSPVALRWLLPEPAQDSPFLQCSSSSCWPSSL